VGIIVGVVFFLIIFTLIGAAASGASYDGLVARGIPARGILLQVNPIGVRVPGSRARPCERRDVVIDVEIPGQPPYEIAASPIIPLNLVRDVLPGATVELRVHKRDRRRMAIVGPGVFFASQLLGQPRAS